MRSDFLTPPAAPENLSFTAEQQAAYDTAREYLYDVDEQSDFLALIPKVVSVERSLPSTEQEADIVTLISPARGHHELFRSLELLEGLEKEEQGLAAKTALTRELTALVLDGHDAAPMTDSHSALKALERLGQAVPRRVCQHPFKKNDIVWVCRTCQADETCVLCHTCFSNSEHEGHDVAFYHAQAGGCCDCGDPDGKCCCDVSFQIICFRILVILLGNNAHRSLGSLWHSLGSSGVLSSPWT